MFSIAFTVLTKSFAWGILYQIERNAMQSTSSWSYKLRIFRRLWINVTPGDDLAGVRALVRVPNLPFTTGYLMGMVMCG